MLNKKCRIFMFWLFYFILLHLISLKTVKSAIYSNNIECYECYSHEKICDTPINPTFLPRRLCGQYTYYDSAGGGRAGGSGYNDYDYENTFLKRAFAFPYFMNFTTRAQQYRQQQQRLQNSTQQISYPRDKRGLDGYYNGGYSCIKIQVSGIESGTIRGCVQANGHNEDICRIAKEHVPAPLRISSCEICKDDLCNSATAMSLSIFMIIISTIIIIILL